MTLIIFILELIEIMPTVYVSRICEESRPVMVICKFKESVFCSEHDNSGTAHLKSKNQKDSVRI